MLWRSAWRNLWRNRRRTGIALASLVSCAAVLVMFDALMHGMFEGSVRSATELSMGEVQVHHPQYRKRRGFYETVEAPEAVLRRAREAGAQGVRRAFGAGLIGHDTHSAAAELWGIVPADERRVFTLAERVEKGAFLNDDSGGAVLGRKLARTLNVGVGDELVVVVQAADGSIGNALYHVRGILGPVGERLDRSLMLLTRADFETLFVAPGFVHEIALTSRGESDPRTLSQRLAGHTQNEVVPWQTLQPMTAEMMDMSQQYTGVLSLIFYLAAGLGVLNTMLMAAHERIPELGLTRALGASPWHVATGFLLEVSLLGVLGALLGSAAGVAGSLYLQKHGIDTRAWSEGGLEAGGVLFDPIWRAQLSWTSALTLPLALWPVVLIAASYPTWIAARVDPIVAMRRV